MSIQDLYDLSGIKFERAEEQPGIWEARSVDGVFTKQMHLAKAGAIVPQHSHQYAHSSLLGIGSVRLWQDGAFIADFKAPAMITIPAHSKHTFMSLEDNTVVYCIHNISRSNEVDIDEEHELEGA